VFSSRDVRTKDFYRDLLDWVVTALTAKALTWEKAALDVFVEAGSGDLVVEFPFTNEKKEAVTIRELKASCGCTEQTVDSRVVAGGGKGSVKLTYAAGDRVGPQSVHVTVTTDEAGTTPSTLNCALIFSRRFHSHRG